MRNIVVLVAVAFLCSACQKPQALPHEEVLMHAVLASQKIESSAFTASLQSSFSFPNEHPIHIDAELQGATTHAGAAFGTSFSATLTNSDQQSAEISGRITRLQDEGIFFHLDGWEQDNALTGTTEVLRTLTDKWIAIPVENQNAYGYLTPDPFFLRDQASMIVVRNDYGLEFDDDRYVYHYGTDMNPALFAERSNDEEQGIVTASGELWIDAKTFRLTRARWNITEEQDGENVRTQIDVQFFGFNKEHTVTVPTDAEEMSIEDLLRPIQNTTPEDEQSESQNEEISYTL